MHSTHIAICYAHSLHLVRCTWIPAPQTSLCHSTPMLSITPSVRAFKIFFGFDLFTLFRVHLVRARPLWWHGSYVRFSLPIRSRRSSLQHRRTVPLTCLELELRGKPSRAARPPASPPLSHAAHVAPTTPTL